MELFKELCFRVVFPMIWLAFFAYAFAVCSLKLVEAWREKRVKMIWLNLWIILMGLYFLR